MEGRVREGLRVSPSIPGLLGVSVDALQHAAASVGLTVHLDEQGAVAAQLLAPGEFPTSNAGNAPILRLEASHRDGLWRLAHLVPGRRGWDDTALPQRIATHGVHLSDETIAAVLAEEVPDPRFRVAPEPDDTVFVDETAAQDPWARALSDAGVVAATTPESARAVATASPVTIAAALLSGREVIALGSGAFATSGLVHAAPEPDDVAAAVASFRAGRRNVRDAVRLAIATEALFNAFAPGRIFAALDGVLRLSPHRPTRTVSIIITSFNYARFLPDAIASALSQTETPHEVIVVDDGSTDGSRDIIANSAGIRSILKENGGQASAMNAGFAAATGEVIVFLDADDRLRADAVARVARADWRGTSRLTSPLLTIDHAGRPLGTYAPIKGGPPAPTGYLGGMVMNEGIVPFAPTSANAFDRTRLTSVWPIPEGDFRISADLYLTLATAPLGETITLDAPIAEYRVHGENLYFDVTGTGLHLNARRQKQRHAACKALAATPPKGLDPTFRDTVQSAMVALSREFSADLLCRPREPQAPPTRPWQNVGRTAWPMVTLGQTISLADPARPFWGCGRGFGRADGIATPVVGQRASLCVRLPPLTTHFRLEAAHCLTGGSATATLRASLNDTPVDILILADRGTFSIEMPSSLLLDWSALVPHAACAAKAAHLTLEFDAAEDVGVALEWIRIDPLPAIPAPAPYAAAGTWLPIRADGPPLLGQGWNHADGDGAAIGAEAAMVHLTTTLRDPLALTLAVRAPNTSGSAPFQVLVEGEPPELDSQTLPNTDLTLVTATTDGPPLDASGKLGIEIVRGADPATGLPAPVVLSAIRVDAAGSPSQPLAPYSPVGVGALVRAPASHTRGLVPIGMDAALSGQTFSIPVPAGLAGRLSLGIDAVETLDAPTPLRLTVGDSTVTAWLGPTNTVPIDLPATIYPPPMLAGELTTPAAPFVLRALTLEAPPPMERATEETYPLGPSALLACAIDPTVLMPADDALWLTAQSVTLRLPPLPQGTTALTVGTLTLPDPAQSLTLSAGGDSAIAHAAGPLSVTLAVADPAAPTLDVRTDVLVSASLFGMGGTRMLAGALTAIDAVAVKV